MAIPAQSPDRAQIVTALFKDIHAAEQAYRTAIELGHDADEINVLMSKQTRERYLASTPTETPLSEKAAEPAPEASTRAEVLGGPAGGTMGTVAPAIAAVGTALLLPGIGLAVAGPVAVALTAAGAAGLATGLIGAFTNWGIPSDRVEQYENALRRGAVVLGVETKSAEAREALIGQWRASGGEMIAKD